MYKSPDLSNGLLPAIVTERGVLAMLVASQILALLLAFSPMSYESIWVRLGIISLFVHCVSAIGFTVLSLLRPYISNYTGTIEYLVIVSVFQIITFVMSLGVTLFEVANSHLLDWSFVAKNNAICLFVTLLFLHFMVIFRDKVTTIATLSRLELDALHARIRPHFLYNSLNTIAELTQQDSDAAEQAVLTLANLSRCALHPNQFVSLTEELALSKKYIELETWRFANKMQVDWFLPANLPDIQVPVLTIQPLVENSVNYGIEGSIAGGIITVEVTFATERVTIVVTNSIGERVSKHKGQGIAQRNIKERLALLYGDSAKLDVQQTNEQYRVALVLPCEAKR
ncbi:two-component system, LytT family, sensor histidine kinase AlgZ [Pseudoalteromonas citrea]|uniref:Two-component system, LytT family, sensor histidine kinase AlgZ n=2 Tax=Pseudoalteromonas citrea TaxID=43655 RepID=A0AAD4FT64_9GAMM|nr:histidine kinase [Pseudoalteromonas citrea]KAF7774266.1 two-component system, LytT family, sensor histidine kinase AlgZ [Pseudoalteromonas citrea]